MSIALKGMTWSHPRGYDPLVACSAQWQRKTGISISWDKRSLQDFESFPVDELARQYDLIIIDHPHVGQVVEEGCLAPLDAPRFESERISMANRAVGASFSSYTYKGRQWALPVDTAAQVQAFVPSRLAEPARSWEAVLDLARQGRVALPLRPPHSLMCFYTLAAHFGTPCQIDAAPMISETAAKPAYDLLSEIFSLVDPLCLTQDPIASYEDMARANSNIACVPLIYGYVNYAMDGFRPELIGFADMPVQGARPPNGSALGGTGLAVSAKSAHIDAAMDFVWWVASGEVQKGLYAHSNGQPGHTDAWEDEAVNVATHGFYRNTRVTLDGAWVRPRHNGYMAFQQSASDYLNNCLSNRRPVKEFVDGLNSLFAASFPKA